MNRRNWTRGQIALAWFLSSAFHVAIIILVYGGVQILSNSRSVREKFDTHVPAPDLPEEVAFDIFDPPTRIQTIPVIPREQPAQPPRKEVVPPTKAVTGTPAPAETVARKESSTDKMGLAGKGGRPLHKPVNPGKSIVYVIDRSASMGKGGKLAQAVACIRLSLRELSPEVRFQIIVYHSSAEVLLPGAEELVAASTSNIAVAEEDLKSLTAEGGSDHLCGIRKGLSFQPDALFVLTDADDLKADHLRVITASNSGRTVIYPVLFGAPRNGANSPFDALARQNRGMTQVIASRP